MEKLTFELDVKTGKLQKGLNDASKMVSSFVTEVEDAKKALDLDPTMSGFTKDQLAIAGTGALEDDENITFLRSLGSALTGLRDAYSDLLVSSPKIGKSFATPLVEARSLMQDSFTIIKDLRKETSGHLSDDLANMMNYTQSRMQSLTADMRDYMKTVSALSSEAKKVWENTQQRRSLQNQAALYVRSNYDPKEKTSLSAMTTGFLDNTSAADQINLYQIKDRENQERLARLSVLSGAFRTDRLESYRYLAGRMRTPVQDVYLHQRVPAAFAESFLNAGEAPDNFTFRKYNSNITQAQKRDQITESYRALIKLVEGGNAKALQFAMQAGLIKTKPGNRREIEHDRDHQIQWLDENYVEGAMLNYVGALAAREAKHALESFPMYRKSISNPENLASLLEKYNKGFEEAYQVMDADKRSAINPFLSEGKIALAQAETARTISGAYGSIKSKVPKLKVQEMVQIPQLTISPDGRMFVGVNDKTKTDYAHAVNFDFSKDPRLGLEASAHDEMITMRRSPMVDAIFAAARTFAANASKASASEFEKQIIGDYPELAKAMFENRTFGYGRNPDDSPMRGLPLLTQMTYDELFEKVNGETQFDKDNNPILKPGDIGTISKQQYFDDLVSRRKSVTMASEGAKTPIDYQVLSMNATGGRARFIMAPKFLIDQLDKEDDEAGLARRSQFFNEMYYDPNGGMRILGPNGKPLDDTLEQGGNIIKYYDAVRKMFSDSVPIEEIGGITPKIASINFDAYYGALKNRTGVEKAKFDGGVFHMPWVSDRDLQGRLGPMKFLSKTGDFQKFLVEGGGAYEILGDTSGKPYMYLPGEGTATTEDYQAYLDFMDQILTRANYVENGQTRQKMIYDPNFKGPLNVKGYEQIKNIKQFEEWRDAKFLQVIDPSIGMLASGDTTNKAFMHGGQISLERAEHFFANRGIVYKPNAILNAELLAKMASPEWTSLTPEQLQEKKERTYTILTPKEQMEYSYANYTPDRFFGYRAMKEAENYIDSKQFISPAALSTVRVSPEMMSLSAKNYRMELQKLNDPREIYKWLSSENDSIGAIVRNNPQSIMYNNAVRQKIEERRNELQENIAKGYFLLPNFQDARAAAPSLYDSLGGFIKDINTDTAANDRLYGQAEDLRLNAGEIYARTKKGSRDVLATRSPYAVGSSIRAVNLYHAATAAEKDRKDRLEKAISHFKMSNDSAVFNVDDFYKLNTGDFDGDLAFLFNSDPTKYGDYVRATERQNDRVMAIMMRLQQNQKKAEQLQAKQKSIDTSFTGTVARHQTGGRIMGGAYLAGQVGRIMTEGPNLTADQIDQIYAQANLMYTYGTDQAKHPELQALQGIDKTYWNAMGEGKTFDRLNKALLEAHNSENKEEAYKNLNIFGYRTPAYFDEIGMQMLDAAQSARMLDPNAFSDLAKAYDEYLAAYSSDPDDIRAARAWYTGILKDKAIGKWQITSGEKINQGQRILADLRKRSSILESEINTGSQGKTGDEIDKLVADKKYLDDTIRVLSRRISDEQAYSLNEDTKNTPLATRFGKTFIADNEIDKWIDDDTKRMAEMIYQRRLASGRLKDEEVRQNKEDQDIHNYNQKRKLLARNFTSFNWSTASEFMPQGAKITTDNVSVYQIPDDASKPTQQKIEPITETFEVDNNSAIAKRYREATIRNIFTGESTSDPDAILGSFAHNAMQDYVAGRAAYVNTHPGANEADLHNAGKTFAQNNLLNKVRYLAGESVAAIPGLKENADAAHIYFERKSASAGKADADLTLSDYEIHSSARAGQQSKLWDSSMARATKRFGMLQNGRANTLIERYLAPIFKEGRVSMAEGQFYATSGQNKGARLALPAGARTVFDTGIPFYPSETDVGGISRIYQDDAGELSKRDLSFKFTPDFVYANRANKANGKTTFTVADYKSSATSGYKGRVQANFYSYLMTELGKQFHSGDHPELEAFGQYYDPSDDTSLITNTEIIRMFEDGVVERLRADYTEERGKQAIDLVRAGWANLSDKVRNGFLDDLKREQLKPEDLRHGKGRTFPDSRTPFELQGTDKAEGYMLPNIEKAIALIAENDETFNDLYYSPGVNPEDAAKIYTGYQDAIQKGKPQNKEYLVKKFADMENTLNDAQSFALKSSGVRFARKDNYTKHIEALEKIYLEDDMKALDAYMDANKDEVAPDIWLMAKDSKVNTDKRSQLLTELQRIGVGNISKDTESLSNYISKMPTSTDDSLYSLYVGAQSGIENLISQNELRKRDSRIWNGTDFKTTTELAVGKELWQKRNEDLAIDRENAAIMADNAERLKKRAALTRQINALADTSIKRPLTSTEQKELTDLQAELAKNADVPLKEKTNTYTDKEEDILLELASTRGTGDYVNNALRIITDAKQQEAEYNKTSAEITVLKQRAEEMFTSALESRSTAQGLSTRRAIYGKNMFMTSLDTQDALTEKRQQELFKQRSSVIDMQADLNKMLNGKVDGKDEIAKTIDIVDADGTVRTVDNPIRLLIEQHVAELQSLVEQIDKQILNVPEDVAKDATRALKDKTFQNQQDYQKREAQITGISTFAANKQEELFNIETKKLDTEDKITSLRAQMADTTDPVKQREQQNEIDRLELEQKQYDRMYTAAQIKMREEAYRGIEDHMRSRDGYLARRNFKLNESEITRLSLVDRDQEQKRIEQAKFRNQENLYRGTISQREFNEEDKKLDARQKYLDSGEYLASRRKELKGVRYRDYIQQDIVQRKIDEEQKDIDKTRAEVKARLDSKQITDAEAAYANLRLDQRQSRVDNGSYQRELEDEIKNASFGQSFMKYSQRMFSPLISRFTRQMFYKIINGTKTFVKEFDASMNEIQAITMKSGEDMQTVRSNTISKALGLRTSVSNVAQTEAALYRQGLSDEEVSTRTDAIIKFATVTKLNVTEATKIITTALQNDLIPSAEQAMDALVALGDSAATTAAEIGKGMQKAAASAKVAGVSYEELTALLTIGTSDTQLSGKQVGTALQTIFTRMRSINTKGWTADINGEKTSANDAEAALKTVGIDIFEDKGLQKMKSSYQILLELSRVWQNLSDVQKSIVTNSLAGTRQTNIFSTLMEGMSEDEGKTLEKYLGLAEGSEGITQSKYEIAMQSLSASFQELKSSWDAVVESFTNTGAITGGLDLVSGLLQHLAELASGNWLGTLATGIAGVGGAIAGLASTVKLMGAFSGGLSPFAGILGILAGIAAGGVLSEGFHFVGSLFDVKTSDEIIKENKEKGIKQIEASSSIRDDLQKKRSDLVKEVESLGKAYNEAMKSGDQSAAIKATDDLRIGLIKLKDIFPDLSDEVDAAMSSLAGWTGVVNEAEKALGNLEKKNLWLKNQEVAVRIANNAQTEFDLFQKELNPYKDREKILSDLTWANPVTFDDSNYSKVLDEYNMFNVSGFLDTATDEQRYALFQNLYSNKSKIFESYLNTRWNALSEQLKDKNVNPDNLKEEFIIPAMNMFLREFIGQPGLDTVEGQIKDRQEVAQTVQSFVDQFSYDGMGGETYSGELINKLMQKHIMSLLYDKDGNRIETQIRDSNGNMIDRWDRNGHVNANLVASEINNLTSKWYNPETGEVDDTVIQSLVDAYAQDSDFAYIVRDRNGKTIKNGRFDSEEEARKFAKARGLGSKNIIKTSNWQSLFMTPGQMIESLRVQASENKNAANLKEFVARAQNQTSISDLEGLYADNDETSILSNVLSANPELLGIYTMARSKKISYKKLQKAAKELGIGGKGSGSSLVDAVMDSVIRSPSFVSQLRTDGVYSQVYESFKKIIGDSADAVLNAIEEGTSDPGVWKVFDRANITQKIKDAMPFSDNIDQVTSYATTALYGSDIEQLESSASRKTELQSYYDYVAAVNRYMNGNAQSGDYSTIANYDKSFTETQLRTRDMSTQVGANQKVFENAIIQRQNDLYQGFLIASLGEGATLEDLDKQSNVSMRRQYALRQGGRGSREYNKAIARSFGLTNRELLNLMYPDFEKELQNWQAQMDENGNIILPPGFETITNPVKLDQYKYSELELANARRNILNGVTREQMGSDLYDAAYNSGSDIFKNAAMGYTRYRGQAFRETNLQIEDLEKQQRLDEAKSKARTSLTNARTYARLYDQQQNESAYLADSVFNAIASGGSRSIPIEDLTKLIDQNPALLKQIEDLGFTVGRYGLGFSGNEENRNTATSALMNLFSGMSSQYQGFSISDLASRAGFARMAMLGTPGFDSYLQNLINDQELFNQYKRGDMVTGVRSNYVQRLLENADNGIEGLTAADRTEFAIRMLQDMKAGKGAEYTDAMKALFSQGFDVNDWNAVLGGDYGARYGRLMENLLLQQASLGTDTVGGAFAYANRQYMQNNKGAIAADKVLGVLNQIDPNSPTALKDLTKSFTSSDASSWAEFIKSSGDLTRKLSDMGVKISDEGIDFDSLNTESYSLADVFAVLRSAAQEASGALSGFKEVLSTGESVERAQAYLNGAYTDENREAFVSYIGNQNLAQTAINEVKNWNDQYGSQQTAYNEFSAMNTLEKQQYLMSHGGVAPTAPPPLDLTQTLSNYEGINGVYAQMLLRGAAVGQQGITDIDRYNGLAMIEAEARQGKLASTWGSDRFGAYNDFTSGIQDSQVWLNAQKTLETSEKLTKLNGNKPVTMFDLKNLKEGTTLYKEVEKSLKPYYSSMKNATDATGDFEKGLLDAKDRALKPFGKETDEIIAKRAKFRGTIKEQNQALKDFRKTQASIMNNQYMREAFRNGKNVKGLDDYIESLGFDKADIKNKKMRDKILEAMDLDELADESLYQDEISAAFGSMQKSFNEYVNNNEIIVDGVQVGVKDGTVTVNTEALLAQFGSALDETQMQLIQEALARGVDIQWDVKWSNGQTSITPRVVGRAAGGGGLGGGRKSNSGGGGGGGKKETPGETAVKAAKHYVGMAQHMVNMAEADLYHPDKMNTYSEYLGAVEANIFTLQQLGQVWKDQIGILEGHRGAVEEGTDEWWSLTEAINEYQESLAKLEESMDNVKAKMFEEAKEQYGYAISERQHNLNMLTTDRTFYSRTNDYNKELESIDNLLREYGSLDKSYRDAIAMYKALAKEEYDQNGQSDYWWSIQQEIDSTTEALAELKNTMADLRAEKLTITIERQEVEDKPENNAFSMMDIYKTRFQEREDYEAYEKVMKERRELLSMAIKTNSRQVTELEALLGQYEKGSEEWLATRDQIWTVKLDSATKENELVELEVELAETRLAQVTQGYDREVAYMNHANNLYETYSKSYQSVSNYQGYRSALTQEISMFEDLQKSAEKARDAAVAQMAALQKNTPEWYNARDAVYQYEEAIASAYASQMEMKFAVEESLASELIEVYNDRMAVFDQSTKLLENQKKVYDNNNDYSGYIQTLREENKLLAEQTASRREYLAELQSRMSQTTIGTTAWKNLRKEIFDVEQAISSAEVTLDNFANELEKTKIDYYLEKMDRAQSERTHALTMIQYEETKYQNAGELSNYAIMLQKENEVREKSIEALERDLDLLKEELDNVEIGSKQYQRLIDAIKKKEEAIAADSNAMEKNIRLLDETYNKIKQQRKAVEDQVDNEIKKRKQQEKNQLAAQVNLQNQIFNAIKKRYEDSWSLIQKDIQKQKEALNEEKSLLNERLQARKDAMNAEDKYEQLRELENQLALISNDPTRTKDTKELTKKIEDLRKDISWDRAAEETKTATEIIDEQIEAMDEWITINGENLTEMLQDANNFAEEINYVLSGSYEDLVTWMQENNMEFQNSLAETQEQMIQGWETTWKTMHGIVDTYWDQINEILTSKDNFIKFMQESVDYITASEAGKATMVYAWSRGYDAMTGAETVSPEAENYEAHAHEEDGVSAAANEIAKAMAAALKWTYDDSWLSNGVIPVEDLTVTVTPNVDDYDNIWGLPAKTISDLVPTLEEFEDRYKDVGVERDLTPPSDYARVDIGSYSSSGGDYSSRYGYSGGGSSGSGSGSGSKSGSSSKATTKTDQIYGWDGADNIKPLYQKYDDTYGNANNQNSGAKSSTATTVNDNKTKTYARRFASGGIVDYTGPAWVDGSKSKPEAFLNPYDTEMIQRMTDALNYIRLTPTINPSADMFNRPEQNFGDINITINQATLENDADIDEVARRVGRAFTKQLSKEGLNLSRYSF